MNVVMNAVQAVILEHENFEYTDIPDEYKVENTSWRVLKTISGTTKLSNKWWGIIS